MLPLAQITHSAEALGPWPWLLQANVPNILLVLLILSWVVAKLDLPATLKRSAEHISAELDEAEFIRVSAQGQLKVIQEELAALPSRAQALEQQAQQTAEQLVLQQQRLTQQELERLTTQQQRRVEQQAKLLAQEVEQDMLSQVLRSLEEQMTNQANESLHRRLVERFMQDLDQVLASQPSLQLQGGVA